MSRAKVLIVDDEWEFASALAERLTLRDYEAKAVYCAEDAITAARSEPLDVVLLDLKIPGMSGFELLGIIKQFNPDIEVIILTGQMTDNVKPEITAEVFEFIIKPVEINELTVKIDNAMKKRSVNLSKKLQKEQ